MFLTRYHKSQWKRDEERVVAQFLPPRVGLRPFAEFAVLLSGERIGYLLGTGSDAGHRPHGGNKDGH
jgi:hypothetical protein